MFLASVPGSTLRLSFFVKVPAECWKAVEWRELTWPCVLDKAAQWHWLVWLVRSKPPQGCRPHWEQTSPGGAHSAGNKEGRVRSWIMMDMNDSSQSDFSPCQPSHALNTNRQARSQRHTAGQGNTHIFLSSSLPTPLSCWSLGLHFNAPVTAPSLQRLRQRGGENARKKFWAQLAGHGCSETTVLHAN